MLDDELGKPANATCLPELPKDLLPHMGHNDPGLPRSDSGRRLVRGSTLILIGRLISILARFATHLLIVRQLSQGAFGAFAYALTVVGTVQSLVTLGLDRSVPRFVPIFHEQRDHRRLFGTIVLTVLVILSLSLAAILALHGLRGPIGSLVRDDQALVLLLVLIFLAPVQALDDLLINLFAVFARPRAIFYRRYVLAPALRLAVVLIFIVTKSDAFFIAVGYILSSLVGLVVYGTIFVRELRTRGLLDGLSVRSLILPWREVLGFSLPVLTTQLVSTNIMSVLLLGHFWGSASVASFRAVFPASKLNELVSDSFTTLFTPTAARMFARDDRAGLNHLYWRTAVWMAIISFPIFAMTFSLAQPITVLLFGARYEHSAPILAMLSVGFYVNAALGFNALTLQVFGRVRQIMLINVLTVVVNLGLSLLLVPRWGALGAGIASMLGVIVHVVIKQVGLRLGTGIGKFEWRYGRVYGVIALGAAGLLAVQLAASPPFVVSAGLAVVIAFLVVRLNRDVLELEEMFPEVMAIPGARFLVGEGRRREAASTSEGGRGAKLAVPPDDRA